VQLALPEHVHMDVVNRLPAEIVAVHHQAETFLAALFAGQALGAVEQVPGQWLVAFLQVIEGGDVSFRDQQKVNGCLRRDIVKGDDLIVFIELARRNFTSDDLAEQTVHGADSWRWSRPGV